MATDVASPIRAQRIIIRGVNWLGDAVMTTPALARLRQAYPGAEITLLTHEKLADLWKHHPAVTGVLTFAEGESLWSVARTIRSGDFDLAIVFPNSPRSALEMFVARVPQRVGLSTPWRRCFLTRAVAVPTGTVRMRKRSAAEVKALAKTNEPRATFPATSHHAHDYLRLVAAVGADVTPVEPVLHVTDEEVAAFRACWKLETQAEPLFALNPGAEYGPAKRWPADRFVEAAIQLRRETNCHWLIVGGPGDRDLAREIEAHVAAHIGSGFVKNLAGQTTLRELCGALKTSALLLTNDSGPMHVAAAVGTPVVVPFGSTSPELTGPGLPGDRKHALLPGEAPCAPCFLRECPIDFRCMRSIAVADVVAATLRAWRGGVTR